MSLILTFPVLISLLFSVIAYFLSNFRPTASAFFVWVMWLFLDLLAGESLVVLMALLFPNFVVALALTAFANGLWMSVGGFLVSPTILNPFWRYVFHYIDYVRSFQFFDSSNPLDPFSDIPVSLPLSTASLCVSRHDGQRIRWLACVRLWARLRVYVRDVARVTVPD